MAGVLLVVQSLRLLLVLIFPNLKSNLDLCVIDFKGFRRRIKIKMHKMIIFAYQELKNVRFSENLTCFLFLKHPFWDLPFCLITEELQSPSNHREELWKARKIILTYIICNFTKKISFYKRLKQYRSPVFTYQ